jgi:hypothetical protein
MSTDSARTASRKQLAVIVGVAALSLVGAYLLFFAARGGFGWGTTNHGAFVTPQRMLSDLHLRDEAGLALEEAGVWWLWALTPASCGADCENALQQLRALHILLNKDAGRVRRALVMADATPVDAKSVDAKSAGGLREAYPQVRFLTGDLDGLASGIYIVDPIGNLVFWYPFADAGEPVLSDLKRLLKVSQIG